jgi:hypothetical protein
VRFRSSRQAVEKAGERDLPVLENEYRQAIQVRRGVPL